MVVMMIVMIMVRTTVTVTIALLAAVAMTVRITVFDSVMLHSVRVAMTMVVRAALASVSVVVEKHEADKIYKEAQD